MPVTKPQAEMLATLAIACRPHGARRWDASGVMAALAKVNTLDLASVMMAVARAAQDRDLNTPAAIGNTSAPCWIERPVERWMPDKTTPEGRCGICGNRRDRCENGPRFADDDHAFTADFRPERATNVAATVRTLREIKAQGGTDE